MVLKVIKLVRLLCCALVLSAAPAWAQSPPAPKVVVVLAGGGAKGFAHLAVLRQLEKDQVPIARIVGTSMGAVIGGLYAAGLDTRQIEEVIGSLDPAKVALDQLNRLELPSRTREYQQQYPIEFEFGIKDGGLSFARGVSDGQRFLALLQQLLAHVPPSVSFDQLKIPFRAVATRYRDGATQVFDKGGLDLAIRASMAAPGVFAPVEINGEVYVDGGLVANLPVEVALQEGADVVVASYLGADEGAKDPEPGHALAVANHMITLLIRQNERRNLALLRPTDVLVSPALSDVGFAEFGRSAEVIARGETAIGAQRVGFERLAQRVAAARGGQEPPQRAAPAFNEREVRIAEIRVKGQQTVPAAYVQRFFADVLNQAHDPKVLGDLVDQLYTEGYFEQVSYKLDHLGGERYALEVQVTEKAYGPHFFKTSLGFFTELDGVQQFSLGLGYRRPWLTESGTELAVDARLGSQNDFGVRLSQRLTQGLRGEAYAELGMQTIPFYVPARFQALNGRGKIASYDLKRTRAGVGVAYDLSRDTTLRLGLMAGQLSYKVDSARLVGLVIDPALPPFVEPLEDFSDSYGGWRMQWTTDRLDSVSFPTSGYAVNAQWESSLRRGQYQGLQANARWATQWGPHVLNLGLHLGAEKTAFECANCTTPSFLYLGGFQRLSAYRLAELTGDRLLMGSATYMYRLTDGGLLRQRAYLGVIGETGDAWETSDGFKAKHSLGVFLAVDSKIGDIYLGVAKGSQGSRNVFLQLGRRFSF
jgi:NTE family protein